MDRTISFCDEGTSKKIVTIIITAIAVPHEKVLIDAFGGRWQKLSSKSIFAASIHVRAVSSRYNSFEEVPRLERTKLVYEVIVSIPYCS
jgi:hypothetical protein